MADAADAALLTEGFRGARAVYILLPPDPQSRDLRRKWDQQGEAMVKAIRDSGVRYVVFLSSVGADLADGTGPIAGLHAQEERLRKPQERQCAHSSRGSVLRELLRRPRTNQAQGDQWRRGGTGGAVVHDRDARHR